MSRERTHADRHEHFAQPARKAQHAALLVTAGALLLLVAPPPNVSGQRMVNSGHALDANLRIGSGGYNGPARGGGGRVGGGSFRRGAYNPLGVQSGFAGRASGDYGRRGVSGAAVNAYRGGYDRYNAFMDERAYDPTRSSRIGAGRPLMQGRVTGTSSRARSTSSGFEPVYDRAYEAELAPGTYDDPTAQEQANTLSYGVGYSIGERIRAAIGVDLPKADLPSIIAGFRDAVHENTAQMTDEEMEELLHALYEQITNVKVQELLTSNPEFRAEREQNEESGRRLREKLAREADIVTMDNGLMYRVLVEGTGPTPGETDSVSIRLTLLSPEGEPVTEPERRTIYLRSTIEGAHIVLTTMKVGGVWQVALPSSLAHGVNGRPPLHGPGVTLYFEVELLSIN